MSGDVQPRKRKDKSKKKKDEPALPPFVYVKEEPPIIIPSSGNSSPSPSADELIHIYKESRLGGNICAKIIFFLLLGTLTVMVGLIITEYRGSSEVATASDSPWSQMLEGWIDDSPPDKHDDEHEAIADSGEHGDEEEHADHDDGGGHDEEDEEDHEDEHGEEEDTALEPELEARVASNLGSETEVSMEEEEEEEEEGNQDDSGQSGEEADGGKEEEEDGTGADLLEDNEQNDNDEVNEDEPGDEENEDQIQSAEDADEVNEDEQDGDNVSGEEEFIFREIPGVTASAEDTDDTGDLDNTLGDIDQDEEDEFNDSTGQGSDAGYYSDKEKNDDSGEFGNGDEDEAEDDIDNEIDNDDSNDNHDVQDKFYSTNNGLDIEDDTNAEEDDNNFSNIRGDQREEEQEDEEDNDTDTPEQNQEQDDDEISRNVDDYEEVEYEFNTLGATPTHEEEASTEQQMESDDDFEEILELPEATEKENDEETDSMEPTGLALKFGVGLAIIIVAHVVLVRKWNESDEARAATLQLSANPVTGVPRRQTLIPPTIDPSNLIPEPDDVEEYSDEDFDEDEEEDPIRTSIVRESLARKYGKITPEDSEEEEDVDEEEDEELGDDDEEEEEEEAAEVEDDEGPEHEYDKLFGYKLGAAPTKQLSQEEGEEDEDIEDEEEVEDEEEENEHPLHAQPWKSLRQSQQESDPEISDREDISGSEEEPAPKRTGGPKIVEVDPEWPMGPDYPPEQFSTSQSQVQSDLNDLETHLEENPEAVLKRVKSLLQSTSKIPALLSLEARALDKLAEKKHSNELLEEAISAYMALLQVKNLNDDLFLTTAERCINRMRFRGQYGKTIGIHKLLISRFPKDPKHRNDLAISYLMLGRVSPAKNLLEETLQLWPTNGLALVHYGFILKTSENNNEKGSHFLQAGIDTGEPGTMDARFLFHLGDAYNRLGKHLLAEKAYEAGVQKKLFRSKYQRSLYNVDRLTARPWWTLQQTTYAKDLKRFEERWQEIRDEGIAILQSQSKAGAFKDEAENLRDKGEWKQLELYARGQQITSNCKRAPVTCQLIAQFPAAHTCRRGQAKFSVMQPNTHVWPHCGPTNCRLRAHLGLIVPHGAELRVGEEKRSWQEGKMFVFDDSFEHEVWHNGTSMRLVLIVDLWHPELTEQERRSLPSI